MSFPRVGLWRSWERASMAWKRSPVRSRSGPPKHPSAIQCNAKVSVQAGFFYVHRSGLAALLREVRSNWGVGSTGWIANVAERQGFEPWIPCGIHAFQACALSHSAISPLSANLYESTTASVMTQVSESFGCATQCLITDIMYSEACSRSLEMSWFRPLETTLTGWD